MATRTITLSVDAELATLYEQASPQTQRQVQLLFEMVLRGTTEILLREMTTTDPMPLNELLDAVSERA